MKPEDIITTLRVLADVKKWKLASNKRVAAGAVQDVIEFTACKQFLVWRAAGAGVCEDNATKQGRAGSQTA